MRASLTGTAQVESRVTGLPAHLRRASVCAAKLSQAAPLPGEEGAGARGQTDVGWFHKICTLPCEAHSHSSLLKSAAWIERDDSPTLPLTRRQGPPLRPAAETGRPALTVRAESARFAQAETAVPGLCVASARGPHRQGPTRAGAVGGGSIGGWRVRRSRRPGPSPQSRRARCLSHDGSRRRGRGGREARAALRPHQPPPLPLRVRPSPQGTHRLSGPAGRGGRAIRIDAPPQSQRRGPGVAGRSGGRRQGAESAERGVVASLLLIRQLLICQSNRRVGRGAQSHSRFAPRAERSASATRPTSPNRGVHGPCRTRTAAGLRRELGLDSYHSLARRPPPAGDRMDSDGPVAAE